MRTGNPCWPGRFSRSFVWNIISSVMMTLCCGRLAPYGRLLDGRRTFQWHLVRLFIEGSGEDEDISQVHLDLTFSEDVGEERNAAVWSYDIEGDFNAFFAAVEARSDFSMPQGITLRTASVGLEKV